MESEEKDKKEKDEGNLDGCPSLEEELRNLLENLGNQTPTEAPQSPEQVDQDISECSHGSVIERVTTYREQISCVCQCQDHKNKKQVTDSEAVITSDADEDVGSGIPSLEKDRDVFYKDAQSDETPGCLKMPPPCQHIVNRYHSNIVGVRPLRAQAEEGFSGTRMLSKIFRRNKVGKKPSKGDLPYERLREDSGTTVVGDSGAPALYKAKIKRGPPHRFAFDLYSEEKKDVKPRKINNPEFVHRHHEVQCEEPEVFDDYESYVKIRKSMETPRTDSMGCVSENMLTTCTMNTDNVTFSREQYGPNGDYPPQTRNEYIYTKDAAVGGGTKQTKSVKQKDIGANTDGDKKLPKEKGGAEKDQKKGAGGFRDTFLNNCEYTVMNRLPARYEVYTFDHQNAKYLRTTDCPFPLYTEMTIEKTDECATKFWAELFGVAHIFLAFLTAFVLQLFKFLLISLIRPLIIGLVQQFSDYAFKPFLTTCFNGIIQPVFIFFHNIARSFRDLCLPIARGIGHFVTQLARILKSIRLLDVNTNTTNGPFYQPQQNV